MDALVPVPASGRTFAATRRVGLADLDARGRVRLDAVARFLQDVAIDDVEETGWGVPEHLWFVRHIRVDVLAPLLDDRAVELVTWCSGVAALAAGRRWSVTGDRGGRIEADSVWIHLGPDGLPARIGDFSVYAVAAGGRSVSARPQLPAPPVDGPRTAWPLRLTDIDPHGHVNNAVYWQALEHLLAASGPDPRRPLQARLDFREPIDLADALELAASGGSDQFEIAFVTATRVKAAASIRGSARPAPRTGGGSQP